MSTSFPTSLDTLTNPTSTDKLNAGDGHASQHANANDAIEALQAKVGVNNSAVTSSLDYRINALEDQDNEGSTYTPTNETSLNDNVDSVTPALHAVAKVGGAYVIGGGATVDCTAAAATTVGLTLPVSVKSSGTRKIYGSGVTGEGEIVTVSQGLVDDGEGGFDLYIFLSFTSGTTGSVSVNYTAVAYLA